MSSLAQVGEKKTGSGYLSTEFTGQVTSSIEKADRLNKLFLPDRWDTCIYAMQSPPLADAEEI